MEKMKEQIAAVKGVHLGEQNGVGSSKFIVGSRSAQADQKKCKAAKEPLQKLIPQHKHKSMNVNTVDAKEVLKVATNLNEDDNIAGNKSSSTESRESIEGGNNELGRNLQQNKMTQKLDGIGSDAGATGNVAAIKAAGSASKNVQNRCLNEGIFSKHTEIEEEIDNGSGGDLPAFPTDNASPKSGENHNNDSKGHESWTFEGLTDMGYNSSPFMGSNSPASWEAIEEAYKKVRAAADQHFRKQVEISERGCLEFDHRASNVASGSRWRRIKVMFLGKLKSLVKMEPKLDRTHGQEDDKQSRRMTMKSNVKEKKKERSQLLVGCCSKDEVLDCHASK